MHQDSLAVSRDSGQPDDDRDNEMCHTSQVYVTIRLKPLKLQRFNCGHLPDLGDLSLCSFIDVS